MWLCTANIHTYLNFRELSLWAVVKVKVPSVCANMREGALEVGRRALVHAYKVRGKALVTCHTTVHNQE